MCLGEACQRALVKDGVVGLLKKLESSKAIVRSMIFS